jgi:hypothetical protein
MKAKNGRGPATATRLLLFMVAKKATKSRTKQPTTKKSATATSGNRTAPDPRKVREALVNAVLKNSEKLMNALIQAAQAGNYLPIKYLFEFAGISEPIPDGDADAEAGAKARSPAEILLGAGQNRPTKTENPARQETPEA